MKKSFSEFVELNSLQIYRDTDLTQGRIPQTAARIVFYDAERIFRVATFESGAEALKTAAAIARETNYTLDRTARHWIAVFIRQKSGRYQELDISELRDFA